MALFNCLPGNMVYFIMSNLLQMCGPTGVGFLYGKSEILDRMPPWMGKSSSSRELQ